MSFSQSAPAFPILDLAGTPEEIGFAHGRQASEQIAGFLDVGLARLNRYRQYSREDALQRADEFLPMMAEFAPDLVAELEATAYGAGRSLRELVFLHVRTELTYEGLCSAAAVRPPASTGGVLLGQNMDLDPTFAQFGLLIRRRLRGAPTMLGFSWPGLVGYMGLNSAGLGLCVTQLVSPGWRVGVPAYFVSRRLLEQESAAACRGILAEVRRGSSPNWLVADRSGTVIDFETTASRHVALEPSESIFTHTNHYLHPDLATEDRLQAELPDSPARRSRLADLLNAEAAHGGVGVAGFERSLQDHAGFPQSLCRHADNIDGAIESVVSAVFDLDRREMHVAAGPPCRGRYISLRVEDRAASQGSGEGVAATDRDRPRVQFREERER